MLALLTFGISVRVAKVVPNILTTVVRVDGGVGKTGMLVAELMEGSHFVLYAESEMIRGDGVKRLHAVVEGAAIVSGVGDLLLVEASVGNLF